VNALVVGSGLPITVSVEASTYLTFCADAVMTDSTAQTDMISFLSICPELF
jgi:hypothetical protein